MKTSITIEIDINNLSTLTDQRLAQLWHIAQANPADGFASQEPGETAEHIGREIIRRFLKNTEPELWHHQGRHHYWETLRKNGSWLPVNGDDQNRKWTPNAQ